MAGEALEEEQVMMGVIEQAKQLGLLARSLSAEALDIEIRAIMYRNTGVPPATMNKCRLATSDLEGAVESLGVILQNMQAMKSRLYM